VMGEKPPGRIFDDKTGKWIVDEEFKAKFDKMAHLYLTTSISCEELGKQFGMTGPSVQKLFREFCGSVYMQRFKVEEFNIDEEIPTPIQPLCDEATHQLLINKLKMRRKHDYSIQRYPYLFSRLMFDADNGRSLTGSGGLYYRSWQQSINRISIKAALIEMAVCDTLFPALVKEDGMLQYTDKYFEQEKELQDKKDRYLKQLQANSKKMNNLVNVIMEQGKDALGGLLKEKITALESERLAVAEKLQAVERDLTQIPDKKAIEQERLQIVQRLRHPSIAKQQNASFESSGNTDFHCLPFEERKHLINSIFSGTDPHGKKYGIYISHGKGKGKYTWTAYGRLGEWTGWIKGDDYDGGDNFNSTEGGKGMKKSVKPLYIMKY